jgi:hypothetical protein
MTLVFANLALLAITLTLLYRRLARIGGAFAAASACVAFTVLCAFAIHQGGSNYNFVCPYSHETTHGTLLSLAALAAFDSWQRRPTWLRAAGVGALLGLVFLTKVEFTVALGAALLAGLAAAPGSRREKLAGALAALAAACAAPALAFALLARAMPLADALRGVAGAWLYVADERVSGFPLYRVAMGLQPLEHHLTRVAAWGAGTAALLFALRALARRFGPWTLALGSSAVAGALFAALTWVDAFYPLAFCMLACFVAAWRSAANDFKRSPSVAFAAFALVLLLRQVLNARVQFYGFALAAPAVALGVVALTNWIPASLGERARSFRAGVLPWIAAVLAGHLLPMAEGMRWKTIELGRGGDRILADPRGEFFANAVELVERRCPSDGTVLVLPEGAMANYLARRRAPTRNFSYMPPELAMFGDEAVTRALQASPPDLVVLVHRDTLEYGVPFFGRDYARGLFEWIRANYQPIKLWSVVPGQRPLEPGTQFAVAVLERKR